MGGARDQRIRNSHQATGMEDKHLLKLRRFKVLETEQTRV